MPKASHASRKRRSAAITTKAQPKPKPKPQRSLGNNFREIMGLTDDKETFETIKKHLRDVLERHLDWNLRWRDQPDNTWDILDAEVRKVVPQIYETEEQRIAARQYMVTYFRSASWSLRKHKPVYEDHDNDTASATDNEQQDPPASENAVARKYSSSRCGRAAKPSENRKRKIPASSSLESISAAAVEKVSQPSTSVTSTTSVFSQASPSDASQSEPAIREFLRCCKPSLEHLLPLFLPNRMDVQWLSLAFQMAEQYEAMIRTGAGSRGD